MILSDRDIRGLNQTDKALIEPFCEENLQGASYDLCMSSHISVFKKQVKTISLADQKSIDSIYEQREISNKGYILQPGEYVLVAVSEKIAVPVNMVAHIRPRTKFTRMGILVFAQHCNPGYVGKLSLGIYNASPNAVILVPGIHIAQVLFEELKSVPSEEKQYQNKQNAAYMDEDEFRGAIFGGEELSPAAQTVLKNIFKTVSGD